MNLKYFAVMAVALCAALHTANAADKVEAGPRGGRILERTTPKAEFYVEKDRTVSIHFYDSAGKPVTPLAQTASVIAETKSGKVKLEFERKGDALVSKAEMPEGDGYKLVVQLRQSAEAKPQNFRFIYEAHTCSGCKLAEYACSCHD